MMHRTLFHSVALLLLSSIAGICADQPNVIIVLTDDQGYGELSAHGHPYLKTPNLDRLAETGVELTDFHVCAKCSPTRAALMTGRFARHVGVRDADNGRNIIGRKFPVSAEIFSANAYATGIFGKWHLGGHAPFRPQDRGFQEVLVHGNGALGTTGDVWGNDYFDDTYLRNGKEEKFNGYCTDVWFSEAMTFMKQSHDKDVPFFCYLSANAPHGPYNVAQKYIDRYANGTPGIPGARAGMIGNIDENMGRLMQFLESSKLGSNTILIFLTDNGAPSKYGYNGGMRGGKGSSYDGGHRVPFLLRWPKGGMSDGRKNDTLTAHVDLLPTLIDLCGLKVDADTTFDGVSMAPLLRGEEAPENLKGRTLVETFNGVVLTEDWRLVDGKELYNIVDDPAQKKDIASLHPELVKTFREALEASKTREYKVIPRIQLGSEAQPHQAFTIYHWYDKHGFYTHRFITRGELINGIIPVEVAEAGTYTFTLRRWPAVLDLPIRSKPKTVVPEFAPYNPHNTVSKYKALDIRSARLKVGGVNETKPVRKNDTAITFTVELETGATEVETFFRTSNGKTLGAYYLEVRRNR